MDADFNKWLLIPGGGSVLGLILWKFLAKTKLDVTRDKADTTYVEAALKTSKEFMSQREESENRERATHGLLVAEQKASNGYKVEIQGLNERVKVLEREKTEQRELISDLAKLIIRIDPTASIYVRRLIHDSGYPPLGP